MLKDKRCRLHINNYLTTRISFHDIHLIHSSVSYIEFLKPFALRKQIWRHGNNMLSLLAHPQPELPIHDIVEPPQKGLHGITSKLRQKVMRG